MHSDLLRQARQLARLDPKRPKQTNLRRAVSSAYYAIFHFLVDQSCRSVIGARHDQAAYRQILGRAFTHATMKAASKSFAGGTLTAAASKGLPSSFAIPHEVANIADTFVELQNERALADYDLTERFRRNEVLDLAERVDAAIRQFQQLAASNEKRFFLACLWAWRTLAKR